MIMIVANLVEDKSQFVFTIFSNFQVSDSDNKVDKVHRSHRPGRQTSTSLGQLQSRRLAPTDNQLGGQQQQQQHSDQKNSTYSFTENRWYITNYFAGVEPAPGDAATQVHVEPRRLVPYLEKRHSCCCASFHGSCPGASRFHVIRRTFACLNPSKMFQYSL